MSWWIRSVVLVPRSIDRTFFRWEPAPILVCVEDLTEDLDYVSKKCTSTTR
eukprot:COSAG01_NODE_19374_length_1013_cov_2.296499_2_plen_50_part_01